MWKGFILMVVEVRVVVLGPSLPHSPLGLLGNLFNFQPSFPKQTSPVEQTGYKLAAYEPDVAHKRLLFCQQSAINLSQLLSLKN